MASTPIASRPHMPGYGLLPADQGSGLKPWSYAVERLTRTRGYWISTTCPDGRPHSVPIWGVWLTDVFAFSTGVQSVKAKNLANDPRVVIGVEPSEDSIVLEGVAKLQPDPNFLREFKAIYAKKYDMDMDDFAEPVWVVTPTRAFSFGSKGDDFTAGSTRWKF
jgi:hypothetical protein